jgi:hypothetical protein
LILVVAPWRSSDFPSVLEEEKAFYHDGTTTTTATTDGQTDTGSKTEIFFHPLRSIFVVAVVVVVSLW